MSWKSWIGEDNYQETKKDDKFFHELRLTFYTSKNKIWFSWVYNIQCSVSCFKYPNDQNQIQCHKQDTCQANDLSFSLKKIKMFTKYFYTCHLCECCKSSAIQKVSSGKVVALAISLDNPSETAKTSLSEHSTLCRW